MVPALRVRTCLLLLCVVVVIAAVPPAWAGEAVLRIVPAGVTADIAGDRAVWGDRRAPDSSPWHASVRGIDLATGRTSLLQTHSGASFAGTGVAEARVSGGHAVSWGFCLEHPEDQPSLKVYDYAAATTVLDLPALVGGADIDGGVLTWTDSWPVPSAETGDFDLTRAGMAYLLACALAGGEADVPQPSPGTQTFSDVPPDFWAYRYVEYDAAAGVTYGYGNGTFVPRRVGTRDQMAVMLARGVAGGDANVPTGPATPTFADVPAGYWAYDYIEYVNTLVTDAAYSTSPDLLFAPALAQSALVAESWVEQAMGTPVDAFRALQLEAGRLHLRDLGTAQERGVSIPDVLPAAPAVSGSRVAWQGWRDGDWDVYLCDVDWGTEQQTPIRITADPSDQTNPAVSGDVLVWQDQRGGNWDIYLYRLPASPTTTAGVPLTTNPADQINPSVSGNLVVWQDRRNGNWDIYLYDLATETETQLTDDPGDQTDPRIDGGRIVYTSADDQTTICLYDLGAVAPVAHFDADVRVGIAPLTVHFTDATTGGPLWTWQWDFGDGATSRAQNPTHHYERPGLYTVSLAVTSIGGADAITVPDFVTVTFADVPIDYWALTDILACAQADIVYGYPDGNYRPELEVTRDQMAVYIARALAGGDTAVPTGPAAPTFPDVSPDYWAFRYIEYCAANDIVQGYPGGNYRPAEVVNRGQMAVYIARAIASPTGDAGLADYTPPAEPTFSDVTADNDWAWCYRYVEYCAANDIVQGYWDGTYHPERAVTRDQMAVYISRAFVP
jgi:beta propeller repeat protein